MTRTVLAVAVDEGVRLPALLKLEKAGRIQLKRVRDIIKNTKKWINIPEHGQPFTIGLSSIGGPDMIADETVNEVKHMFRKDQNDDFLHIYSAYQIRANYFITGDKDDFIKSGRRERLEALMPGLKIRTTDEFLDEIGEKK